MKKIIFIKIVVLLVIFPGRIFARENLSKAAIYGVPQRSASLNAISINVINQCNDLLTSLGRFMPVEQNELKAAFNKNYGVKSDLGYYSAVSREMGADIFIIFSIYEQSKTLYAEMRVFSLTKRYKNLEKKIRVKSKIKNNIPLLLAREVAKLHDGILVKARVIKKVNPNLYLINAGEWHGLKEKTYSLEPGGSIDVLQTNRFSSFVKISETNSQSFEIDLKPEVDNIFDRINSLLEENIIKKYSIEKKHLQGVHSEKKLFEGMCIVNPGSNVCLPVYGSFLSTYYMGFENAKPDNYTLWLSALILSTQVMYVSSVTIEFNARFACFALVNYSVYCFSYIFRSACISNEIRIGFTSTL
jgi:hypothetical protein